MTQQEKQLLLKDLCARLPYGVKVCISSESDGRLQINTVTLDIDFLHKYMLDGGYYSHGLFYKTPGFQLLPYLRPMSSMTEEEKEYIKNRWCYNDWDIDGPSSLWREKIDVEDADGIIDYFNEHHLDYRELIPMGLALEASPDMYKTE